MASPRVAVMSVHTSPMDQPGSGDSGGMNVYIRAVTERLARQGVEVDLFVRCRGGDDHEVREIAPGIRVVSVKAGPCTPVPKDALPRFLSEFLGGVLKIAHEDGNGYDIVHSHYWLSGVVGQALKTSLGAPLVASFHTLGKVKNYSLARGESPGAGGAPGGGGARDRRRRPDPRPHAARGGASWWACTAPTPRTSAWCRPASTTPSSTRVTARPRASGCICRACAWRSTSAACSRTRGPTSRCGPSPRPWPATPRSPDNLVLGIVGGPSGADHGAEMSRLLTMAGALGVSDRVILFPPQPQVRLADFYVGRRRRPGAVALGVVRSGGPGGAGLRHAGGGGLGGRASLRRGGRADRVPGGGARPGRSRGDGCWRSCATPAARRGSGATPRVWRCASHGTPPRTNCSVCTAKCSARALARRRVRALIRAHRDARHARVAFVTLCPKPTTCAYAV